MAKKKKAGTKKAKKVGAKKKDLLVTLRTMAPPKVKSAKLGSAKETAISLSTHKARAGWFNAREAWPLREASLDALLSGRADAHARIPAASGTVLWNEAGPTNIGGRTTAIVVDPDDSDRIWIGAAGGGVWFSADGGGSWAPQWHAEPTLNIGALCADPVDSNHIYCGTGEANLSADSHAGVGVYHTLDGGQNWSLLAAANSHGLPQRIGRIAVDPFDGRRLFLSGVGHQNADARGIFFSTNGGVSWAPVAGLFPAPYHAHDVVFHPQTSGRVFVTIDAAGMNTGIWRSADGGSTWTQLTSGLPPSHSMRRISLAIAPSNPDVMYAQIATVHGAALGVFRSANGGDTWTSIGGSHFKDERQMNYNNTISVDPADADVVLCGGVDIHLTKDGGASWKRVTDWAAKRNEDTNYAHADQHGLVYATSDLVYAVNDGGLDVSPDGGATWQNRSAGLATNMFYDWCSAATDADMHGGGMQDNGTWLTIDGQPDSYFETTGGDGGFCAIDPNDARHFFTSSQFMRINRFRRSDGWTVDMGPLEKGPRPWMAFIAIDPDRPKRLFVGSTRIWRSTNDGASWVIVSGALDGSFVTCIEISRANTDRIYAGTENGGIFRSDDGGATWSGNIASSVLPGRTVTRLRTPAQDADVVYATVANFGNSHLFRSTDGGDNWTDVDGGWLPDVPHHGIVIPSASAELIYICNDAGVFRSVDAAWSWTNLTSGLPTTMVVDLVLHEASDTLYAATYGRSAWKLDLGLLT